MEKEDLENKKERGDRESNVSEQRTLKMCYQYKKENAVLTVGFYDHNGHLQSEGA